MNNLYQKQIEKLISAELLSLDEQETMRNIANRALTQALSTKHKVGSLPPSPLAHLIRESDTVGQAYNKINGPAFLTLAHAFAHPKSSVKQLDTIATSLAAGTPVPDVDENLTGLNDNENADNMVPVTMAAAELLAIDPTNNLPEQEAQELQQLLEKSYSCAIHTGYLGGSPVKRARRVFRRTPLIAGDVKSVFQDISQCVHYALSALGVQTETTDEEKIANLTASDWERWLQTSADADLDKALSSTQAITSAMTDSSSAIQEIQPDFDIQTWLSTNLAKTEESTKNAQITYSERESQLIRLKWFSFFNNLSPEVLDIIKDAIPDATSTTTAMQSLASAALLLATSPSVKVKQEWSIMLQQLSQCPTSAAVSAAISNTPEL